MADINLLYSMYTYGRVLMKVKYIAARPHASVSAITGASLCQYPWHRTKWEPKHPHAALRISACRGDQPALCRRQLRGAVAAGTQRSAMRKKHVDATAPRLVPSCQSTGQACALSGAERRRAEQPFSRRARVLRSAGAGWWREQEGRKKKRKKGIRAHLETNQGLPTTPSPVPTTPRGLVTPEAEDSAIGGRSYSVAGDLGFIESRGLY
ncbi:hypothetical protein C8R47DRAFT_105761 [Mycena vitilis]|nr:hypothetical protein C8R47DRAFT_105761 [Mycena vitilis]